MPGTITARCACGWEATSPEAVVVAATIEHGRRLHNMEATPEQVIAAAVRVDDTGAASESIASPATAPPRSSAPQGIA